MASEPDIAALFAPVSVPDTVAGVLAEADSVLVQLDDPVDAELWGSDLIGALASSAPGPRSLTDSLAGALVPAAEAASAPGSLALLRILAAIGPACATPPGRPRRGYEPAASPTRRGRRASAPRSRATAGTTPTWAAVRNR